MTGPPAVSARPIANTDVLCFGPQDLPFDALPDGVLHPRRVAEGVVAGVGDYGNKMGIPTVAGAIRFDDGYTANPLVFCGCVGLLPTGSHPRGARPGDRVVVIGGRTGRDGLRGATFSSMDIAADTHVVAGSSVQIGHPIHEKQVLEVVLAARDARLYHAITDCGAGGLSSAVGELGQDVGVDVELQRVPLKYPGLRPWEIWLSESQERMVLAVPPAHLDALRGLCARHHVEAADLGAFTGDGQLTVRHGGAPVASLSMAFLHGGRPPRTLRSTWSPPARAPVDTAGVDLRDALLALLASPNIASNEAVIRSFDHEVQGGTLGRPFAGPDQRGPSDAAVLRPLDLQLDGADRLGVVLSVGINPRFGRLDPYAMAWSVVDEAFRNLVCVGGDPDRVALLDNFCWGNPRLPDRLGALVRCVEGCHDAALAYAAPFISGKDSLYNEYTGVDGVRQAIPGTLLISAVATIPDTDRRVSSALRREGSLLVLVGETRGELGGSELSAWLGQGGGAAPAPVRAPLARYRAIHALIGAGRALAAHDCSEGGLRVAAAEMLSGGAPGGLRLRLDALPGADGLDDVTRAFSESNGRILLEVDPADIGAVREALGEVPHAVVGEVGGVGLQVEGGPTWAVGALRAAFGGKGR